MFVSCKNRIRGLGRSTNVIAQHGVRINVETMSNVLTTGCVIRKRQWPYDPQYILQLHMPRSKGFSKNYDSYIHIYKGFWSCDCPVILGENGLGGFLLRVLLLGWSLKNCLGQTLLCILGVLLRFLQGCIFSWN